MKITFRCACGRKYSVAAELAGKAVRCNECGARRCVPEAPADPDLGLDLYGLDEAPAAREIPATRAEGPPGPGSKPKPKKSKVLRGLREALPRGDDLRYPATGGAVLVLTLVAAVVGGIFAKAFFVFVALAAVACSLWAAGSWLAAAKGEGLAAALAVSPALAASAAFFAALLAADPGPRGPLVTAAVASAWFVGFLARRRGGEYRRPVALGSMAVMMVASFAILLNIARYNIAQGVVPPPVDAPSIARPAGGPSPGNSAPADSVERALRERGTLADARGGFRPAPARVGGARDPLESPPPGAFATIRYDAPPGRLAAYLTPDPGDGRKHPAIVWIAGGDCNSIGDVWSPRGPANDQTAAAYRRAGIVMMFPSLRGAHDNPGEKEGYLGEVDDVLAAADFLARQAYVDPARVYLGGHSTGGTLALLAAESSDRFRAVFSFGPVDDVRRYPPEYAPFDKADGREAVVRSPGYWLHSVRSPTFVFEGETGNIESLRAMRAKSTSPLLRFYEVPGSDHFSLLAPTNRLIAAKILRDDGPTTGLAFAPEDLSAPRGP